jgi:hypothetical protein
LVPPALLVACVDSSFVSCRVVSHACVVCVVLCRVRVSCVVVCVICDQMVYLVGSMMNTDVKTKKKLIKSSSNTALILWTEVIYRFQRYTTRHDTTRHDTRRTRNTPHTARMQHTSTGW